MAAKPPPTAKVVDDDAAYLVRAGAADLNEDEAAKKRGRKMLLVGLAILVVLAVIATGVGVGVSTSKKHNGKSSGSNRAATPTSTPSNASDYTVEDLKFLPAPGTPEAEALRRNGTAETKLAYQIADDAKNITPEKVIKFLDYLDGVAHLTEKGVDVQYYKDQAYFIALWFRSKGYTAALELLRGYAKGEVPNLLELGQSLEQVISVLQAKKDFKAFMAWPHDGDKELSNATLTTLNETDVDMTRRVGHLLSGNTVGKKAGSANSRAQYSASSLTNPIYQYENVVKPQGFMNNPSIMGYPGFKLVTVRVVFHLLMFNDGGYAAPINAYNYGSNPGRHLIAVMNKAYRRARVQFVMDEWRNDPRKWRYLNMGNVAKWQYCANKAEACHCKLALKHNKDPRKYVNLWISGSEDYPGLDSPDIGYSSLIPRALDSCQQTLGWKHPASKTAHLWFLYDQIDPAYGNNPSAYEDGGMTVIHEMGHYFGLLHTHQGDCANQDGISDTPGQVATQDTQYYDRLVSWCIANFRSTNAPTKALKSMDSCGGDKYIDNVFNFMSYTHSACYKLFTQAQVKRMQRFIQDYHHRWVVPKKKKKKPTKGK